MKRLVCLVVLVVIAMQAVIPPEYKVVMGGLGAEHDKKTVEKIICEHYNNAEIINQDVGSLRSDKGMGSMTLLCWMLFNGYYDLANAILVNPVYDVNMSVRGKFSWIRNQKTHDEDIKDRKINALGWIIGAPGDNLSNNQKKNMVEVLLDHGAIKTWDNPSWSDWDTGVYFNKALPPDSRDFFDDIKGLIDDYYTGKKKPTYKKLFGDGTIFACKPLEAEVQDSVDTLQLLAQSLINIKS